MYKIPESIIYAHNKWPMTSICFARACNQSCRVLPSLVHGRQGIGFAIRGTVSRLVVQYIAINDDWLNDFKDCGTTSRHSMVVSYGSLGSGFVLLYREHCSGVDSTTKTQWPVMQSTTVSCWVAFLRYTARKQQHQTHLNKRYRRPQNVTRRLLTLILDWPTIYSERPIARLVTASRRTSPGAPLIKMV